MATKYDGDKIEKAIMTFCKNQFRSLGEIASKLGMNKNTLRAGYLYPMVKAGTLKRSTTLPFKSTTKYRSAKAGH